MKKGQDAKDELQQEVMIENDLGNRSGIIGIKIGFEQFFRVFREYRRSHPKRQENRAAEPGCGVQNAEAAQEGDHNMFAASSASSERSPFWNSMCAATASPRNRLTI